VRSPLAACSEAPGDAACQDFLGKSRNPYYVGDEPGLTQTSGWAGAWTSAPSVYAVVARNTGDVVAAVNFARENNLRLVVKGGGHSYQGGSSASDSLLVWTRPMSAVVLHDAFVGEGCAASEAALPAVSVGAGAIWMQAYDAVVTRDGRYVQGGGCTTVGVAGLVQSGGFGSFSKAFGLAASGLLEAEIVTADGAVRIANACTNPDLFWALKGGGGGSFGVVTRLTLRTHELPDVFGGVFGTIRAASDAAFRRLLARFVAFCAEHLFDHHWGETATFRPDNTLSVGMVFQGLERSRAEGAWKPFLDWVAGSPEDFTVVAPFGVLAAPARRLWDAAWIKRNVPGLAIADDRPGAPEGNMFWAGDAGQVGQFLHAYDSVWLPASLLSHDQQERLCEALFRATRRWPVALHFNKGLAGAPPEAIAAARDTAMHPSVLDAFALAISGAQGAPAFPGLPGPQPGLTAARRRAANVAAAMAELRALAPGAGSYVAESDYFNGDWQSAHWGPNYPRLLAVKKKYDPSRLFFVHHGVGSEGWSADDFTKLN
jgi:FAD/FMN-containing dehydrogenase